MTLDKVSKYHSKWTDLEERFVAENYMSGEPVEKIASSLGRTNSSIRSKVQILRNNGVLKQFQGKVVENKVNELMTGSSKVTIDNNKMTIEK